MRHNKIYHDDQAMGKFVHGRPRMLTCDLFAVANLVTSFTAPVSAAHLSTPSIQLQVC